MPAEIFMVHPEDAGKTLAGFLRGQLRGQSWNQVRQLVASGRIHVGDAACLDAARRLRDGEVIEVRKAAARRLERPNIVIRHLDEHLVVVEKPSGIATVRHPVERDWPRRRKALNPTLEDLLPPLIGSGEHRTRKGRWPRLRIVHRLDKETSGLVVFARTVLAERALGRQFRNHTVHRRYLAIVGGQMRAQKLESHLVRDRGDGRRGSTPLRGTGKQAITHVEVAERLPGFTLLSCRLETGRTHQIRIHLAEAGHPVCGEKVYNRRRDGTILPDASLAPRLALHASELGFTHPVTEKQVQWAMPLPADLEAFSGRLRAKAETGPDAISERKKRG
jgi:23S rRNA pseudouridine1911/1915/1917 synthase